MLIFPDVTITSMPVKATLGICKVLLIFISSESYSSMGFVDGFFSHLVYVSFFCGHTIWEIFVYKLISESMP